MATCKLYDRSDRNASTQLVFLATLQLLVKIVKYVCRNTACFNFIPGLCYNGFEPPRADLEPHLRIWTLPPPKQSCKNDACQTKLTKYFTFSIFFPIEMQLVKD